VEQRVLPRPIKLPRLGLGLAVSVALAGWAASVASAAWECLQARWCLSLEPESESEPERSLGRCPVWGCPVYTQVECSQAQELGSRVWGCSLGFPPEPESRPRPQVEVELSPESQESDPLGASSLASRWGTPSRHPSCQVAMDCPTALGNCPSAMGPEEWLVPGPRLGTRRGQELARRLQQQQLKQQSMVREPGFSLVLEAAAFPAGPAQFLGSEASQGRGRRLLRQRLLRRQLSSELLEAWCPVHQALAPRELGSQVLGSQVLESQVLESQVLESQELCHQLQLLKQPNSGPEPEWVLEAFPLTGSGSVLGAFLVSVSELESEVFLELPFPLQPRQQPRPRQPSSVLEGQEPWEGWCRGSETEWQVSQV